MKTPQEMEHQIGSYNQYEELCCLQVKEEELIGFRISQMHFVLRLASKILLDDCFIIKKIIILYCHTSRLVIIEFGNV